MSVAQRSFFGLTGSIPDQLQIKFTKTVSDGLDFRGRHSGKALLSFLDSRYDMLKRDARGPPC